MNIKTKITSLISVLPKKDRPIALELIKKEDFQTLVELVDSDIKMAKIELDKLQKDSDEDAIEENKLIISDMQALKIVVQSYIDEEDAFFNSLDTSSRIMGMTFDDSNDFFINEYI